MARWEPGVGERLSAAALELYYERGFEQTMVSEIADRVGVTSRTFFRHFADKREVLFPDWTPLREVIAAALEAAPRGASAMELTILALNAVARVFEVDPDRVRRRQAIIAATTELQERELIKLAQLTADLAEGLRHRGVEPVDADLAAQTGLAIYRVAFDQWTAGSGSATFSAIVADTAKRLQGLTK